MGQLDTGNVGAGEWPQINGYTQITVLILLTADKKLNSNSDENEEKKQTHKWMFDGYSFSVSS